MNDLHLIEEDLGATGNAWLLDEVDGDCHRHFRQDAEGQTEVAPDKTDWTEDAQ